MSVFGEITSVCTTKQHKTTADSEKEIFKMSGQDLLPNYLYPVINFARRTHGADILLQILMEPL